MAIINTRPSKTGEALNGRPRETLRVNASGNGEP